MNIEEEITLALWGGWAEVDARDAAKCLAPLVKRAQAEALREAATEAYPNLGTEASGHTSTYSVRKWLSGKATELRTKEQDR